MNMLKTKLMLNTLAKEKEILNGKLFESVQGHNKLGQLLKAEPTDKKTFRPKVRMGRSAHGRHYQIITPQEMCYFL